jgi:MYXO-CTERM domain-containing protein
VNGDSGNDIYVHYFHPEGQFGWYPNSGDFGYTKIALQDGGNFDSVGLIVGTGFQGDYPVYYELREAGVPVLTGSIPGMYNSGSGQYLGFSGGGFDEVLLRDSIGPISGVTTGGSAENALALDAIETTGSQVSASPEPASLTLFAFSGAALLGYAGLRRRRKTAIA